jgi:uncharacterized protein YigE (DUF2233 family)
MKKLLLLILDLVLVVVLTGFSYKTTVSSKNKFTVTKHHLNDVNQDLYVVTVKENSMKFGISKGSSKKSNFFLNANFFTPSGKPIGEVVINHKKLSRRISGGGFFYTVNGVPHVSVYSHPSNAENVAQTKYVGVINGKLNKSLFKGSLNTSEMKRQIMGVKKNGDLVIILTDMTSNVTMKRLSQFALEMGLQNAILFDGGSSIDLFIRDSQNSFSLMTLPHLLKKLSNTPEPPIYIVGNFN